MQASISPSARSSPSVQTAPQPVWSSERTTRPATVPPQPDTALARAAAFARTQGGVLLGHQARHVLGTSGLLAAVRAGALVKLWHGAYAFPPVSLQVRLRAADLTMGRRVLPCLDTAAAMHGFDISDDERLHLLADRDMTSKRLPLVMHRMSPASPLVHVHGRPVMDGVETAVRVAARQPSEQHALAVLDAALASRLVLRSDQMQLMAQDLHVNGVRQVRRVVGWADSRAESPRESWLRWVFLDAGLPPPVPQLWVRVSPGRSYRLDLAWPRYKVACEYDGVAFHTGEALYRDRQRLNDLIADGWLITFATGSMVTSGRHLLVAQVSDLLRRRGAAI